MALRKFAKIWLWELKTLLHLHLQNGGTIAQLVEQRTENPCVPGSIPGGTTRILSHLQRFLLWVVFLF